MTYAATTEVAFEKSIAELITWIKRAGADDIAQLDGAERYAIEFTLADRRIRFVLPLPKIEQLPTHNGRREMLTREQRLSKLAQARRQRGRALLLVVRAKLESVESGIETIEQAFLAQVVLPGGQTVHERIADRVALEYQTGSPDVSGLLPGPEGACG